MAAKGLTIIGSGPALTTIGAIRPPSIPFLPPVDTLILRGLTITPYFSSGPFQTTVDCPIHVEDASWLHVEDCVLVGTGRTCGAWLVDVRHASFVRCELVGASGSNPILGGYADAVPALDVRSGLFPQASVLLHDCTLRGGDGFGNLSFVTGGAGGHALFASNARVLSFGSTFQGGDSGPAQPGSGGLPGSGAHLVLNASIQHQGSTFVPGIDPAPGTSIAPPFLLETNSTEVPVPGTPALLETSGKTPSGQVATLSLTGEPGSMAALLLGSPFPFFDVPGVLGQLVMSAPLAVVVLPPLPASGNWSVSLSIPALPSGVLAASAGVQAYVIPPSGGPIALTNLSVATGVAPGL
ncbi:MAG: hypothetical protein ACF8XB_05680 [Planctomycetota bacterium JB042]